MAEERVQRRLAAILAADMVGYSRLIGSDEEGTIARQQSCRAELIDPEIKSHGGRIVKTMGDGLLVEFPSVVDAVKCAAAMQLAMADREANVPEIRRIQFRVGINLGDIVIDGDDILGDGVNVAARLEGEADPGGICISGDAYRQVVGKVDYAFEDLGEISLKNIATPLRAYRLLLSSPRAAASAIPKLHEKPSIAVLPFDNMAGDQEHEYFADGISEDLITALSHVRWFRVVSRNSSFSYKGSATDIRRVANELGVGYVLEGSVRKSGARVRITAQLIDGDTGTHLWAERYDRDLDDIFEIQDEITQRVTGAIEPALDQAESARSLHKPTEELGAWELNQRGNWHMWQRTQDHVEEAINFFHHAVELDPGLARAYGNMSQCYRTQFVYGWPGEVDDLSQAAIAVAKKAIDLDDQDSWGHAQLGTILAVTGDYRPARLESEIALQQNPSSPLAYFALATCLTFQGDPASAIEPLEAALLLSPNDPWQGSVMTRLAEASLFMREPEKSAEWAERASRLPPVSIWVHATHAAALGHLGRLDDAEKVSRSLLKLKPDFTCKFILTVRRGIRDDFYKHFAEGLQKAGLPES
jgi:adenylate cyclase